MATETFLIVLKKWLGENSPVDTPEFAQFIRALTPEDRADYKATLRSLNIEFAE